MASESVKILIEADDQATAEIQEAQKAFSNFTKVKERELQMLKLEKTALEQGEEAALAMKLQIEGLDEATAKLIARERMHIAELKKMKQEQSKVGPSGPSAASGTKASAEFFGAVASFAGAGELGSIAGQVGGLTEKVTQFSEVSKAGGAGAMLFKAGLVAAAGAIGFAVGNAIGNAIFQVDKWNKEIEKATDRANELKQAMASVNQVRFNDATADIELIRDPEEKKAAYQAMLADLKKNLVGVEQQSQQSQKAAKEWAEAWQITGNRKEYAKQAEQQVKDDKERLKALQEQAKEIERILGIEAERAAKQKENQSKDFIESLREQLTLEKAIGDERFKLEAQKSAVGDDVGVAADLLKQIDLQKQLVEAEKIAAQEKEQKIKKEEASRKRILDLIANENQKNQERLVLLGRGTDVIAEMQKKLADPATTQSEAERLKIQTKILQDLDRQRGTESQMQSERLQAAKAIALVQQGVNESEAARLAAESERISKLEKNKQNEAEINKTLMQPQEAFQSRFLTRGPMSNPNERLEKEAEKQTRLQEEQRKLLADLKENTKPRSVNVKDVRFEVVGG